MDPNIQNITHQLTDLQNSQDRIASEQHFITLMSHIKGVAENAAKIEMAAASKELTKQVIEIAISQAKLEIAESNKELADEIKDVAETAAKVIIADTARELSEKVTNILIVQGRMEEKLDNLITSILNIKMDCVICDNRLKKLENIQHTITTIGKITVGIFTVITGIFVKFILWPLKIVH